MDALRDLAAEGPVVFYDGECGLCDSFVAILVRNDRRRVLRYATLQGRTAERTLERREADPAGWTIVLVDEWGVHERSSAALRAIGRLGGAWRLASALLAVPRPIRDGVYRWVARNRYRWFGRRDSCALPAPAVRARFLP